MIPVNGSVLSMLYKRTGFCDIVLRNPAVSYVNLQSSPCGGPESRMARIHIIQPGFSSFSQPELCPVVGAFLKALFEAASQL